MARKKKGTRATRAVKKVDEWDPYRFKVVAVPHRLSPEQAAKRLEDTVNRALEANRHSEQNVDIHPGATMVVIYPLPRPLNTPEAEFEVLVKGVMHMVDLSGDLKKEVPPALTSLIKDNNIPLRKVREYLTLPKEKWETHSCGNQNCMFVSVAALVVEALQVHINQNMQ